MTHKIERCSQVFFILYRHTVTLCCLPVMDLSTHRVSCSSSLAQKSACTAHHHVCTRVDERRGRSSHHDGHRKGAEGTETYTSWTSVTTTAKKHHTHNPRIFLLEPSERMVCTTLVNSRTNTMRVSNEMTMRNRAMTTRKFNRWWRRSWKP